MTALHAVILEGVMTKSTKTMAKALGDTELVLLASGGKHADHLIEIPEGMKPATRQRAAANLVKRGLAEERAARANDPIWREDESGRFTLAITAAGLATIGIEEGERPDGKAINEGSAASPMGGDGDAPRQGTKGAMVVSLLSRKSGASIDELTAATGWLPHTTRAALTGLRKRGYAIERQKSADGSSVYRIPLPEPAPAKRRRKTETTELRAA